MVTLSRDIAALKRLDSLGLKPQQYMPIVREIERWCKNSGEEWTVARLKALRLRFLHFVAGLPSPKDDWIAHRSDGRPKGPFGVLWRRFGSSMELIEVWNVLMIYTCFKSSRITKKQWAKFTSGVCRPPVTAGGLERARKYVHLGFESLSKGLRLPPVPEECGDPLLLYEYSDEKSSPESTTLGAPSSPQSAVLIDAVRFLARNPMLRHMCPQISAGTLVGLEALMAKVELQEMEWGINPYSLPPVIGRIACVQERGYKARFIANPGIVFQAMLGPLFRWLGQVAMSIPGNYQFDQDGGRTAVMERLRSSGFAHSVDLSGATDNAPSSLQVEILERCGVGQEWCSLLEYCCRGMWMAPKEILDHEDSWFSQDGKTILEQPKGGFLNWTVGTPLGLKPTFHLFSIWHALLSEGICYSLRDSDFTYVPGHGRVLVGDDIVFFDEEASDVYVSVMDDLGIPVSKEKSVRSNCLAEFTSRLITPSQVIPAPKWGPLDDDTFYDIARALGPRVQGFLRWRQRRVLWLLGEVPEEFNGLGWNYQGKPWFDRSRAFLDIIPRGSASELTTAGSRIRSLAWKSKLLSQYGLGVVTYDDSSDVQSETECVLWLYGPVANGNIDAFRHNTADVLARLRDAERWAEEGRAFRNELLSKLPGRLMRDYTNAKELHGEVAALRLLRKRIEMVSRYVSTREPRRPLSTLQQLENLIKAVGLG